MTPEQSLAFLSERLPPGCALPVIGIAGDPYAADRRAWWARAWTPACKRLREDMNLFVGISAFRPSEGDTLVPGGFLPRRKDNFVCCVAIMIDDLGGGAGAKMPLDAMKLEPTWLVETSQDNYQAWYVLEHPCFDADRVAGFLDALIYKGLCAKTDPGMSGVSRVGRLGGGVNAKAKYGPGGWKVRTARASMARYTLEEIALAYGVPAVSPPADREAAVLPDGLVARSPEAEMLLALFDLKGMVNGRPDAQGWWPITCPWVDTHTDRADTGAAYCLPGEKNGWLGGFKCHHGHCTKRTIGSVLRWAEENIEEIEHGYK